MSYRYIPAGWDELEEPDYYELNKGEDLMAKGQQQTAFDGMKMEVDPDLTKAGMELRAARKERMKFSKEEKAAIEKCKAIMREKDIMLYKDDSEDPSLELERIPGKEKIKVNGVVDDDDSEE